MIDGKLDAVLPLTLRDYERFKVLNYSIHRFLEDLNILWIVTKANEHRELSSRIKEGNYRVISEESIIPEVRFYNPLVRPIVSVKFRKNMGLGWYVQQLVKMAIAPAVETDFYLTFDSDVVCLRPVRYSDLVIDGRAITNTTNEDWHADWYEWSERVLGLQRSGITHGVTPAIFSKKAMIRLQEYLSQKSGFLFKAISKLARQESLSERLCISWRSYLLRNIPWTEYGLYNTYLEAMNSFHEFHFQGGEYAIYDTYNSAWFKDTACDWDPRKIHEKSFFMVVQSGMGLSPDYIMKRITSL